MKLSDLPAYVAAEIGPALAIAATTGNPSSCSSSIFREEEQGCAPCWYPEPGFALLAVNKDLFLDEYRWNEDDSDEQVMRSLLSGGGPDVWLDIAMFEEYPETIFAFMSESMGQAGMSFDDVGAFCSFQQLYDYVLETYGYAFKHEAVEIDYQVLIGLCGKGE